MFIKRSESDEAIQCLRSRLGGMGRTCLDRHGAPHLAMTTRDVLNVVAKPRSARVTRRMPAAARNAAPLPALAEAKLAAATLHL
jgi:hypothetical protein